MRPAALLLDWYDRHRRALPWRETTPDPYRVWLSEIMLQQTTTTAVAPYYARFLARWPDVTALAAAADFEVMSAWAGLGYYARARNLLACARTVAAAGGRFPGDEAGLRALPGIGAYTAAAIAAIAFGQRAVVVDGNVERVIARLFAIETPLPQARLQVREQTDAITPNERAGDFAQAMMDLGATICTPTRPACLLCPLEAQCRARKLGLEGELPRRSPKAARPHRYGVAYVAQKSSGALLLRTRDAKGLLGGMTEFPGIWPLESQRSPVQGAPVEAEWRAGGTAEHGFTHFDLTLTVLVGWSDAPAPEGMRWVAPDNLYREALPTLTRRVATAAGVDLPAVRSAGANSGRAQAPARNDPSRRGQPERQGRQKRE